jgi:hypothetical protein
MKVIWRPVRQGGTTKYTKGTKREGLRQSRPRFCLLSCDSCVSWFFPVFQVKSQHESPMVPANAGDRDDPRRAAARGECESGIQGCKAAFAVRGGSPLRSSPEFGVVDRGKATSPRSSAVWGRNHVGREIEFATWPGTYCRRRRRIFALVHSHRLDCRDPPVEAWL